MAVTLLQAAVTEAVDPREAVIIQMFTQESQIMKDMPFKRIPGRYYDYARDAALPTGGYFRGVNGTWTESSGLLAPYREHLKIIGGVVDIDRYISTTDPNGAQSEKQIQTRLKIQALMNEFDRCIVEGSELSNPLEIVGWRARCTASNQLVLNASGGGALTLRKLHEAMDAVKGPNSEKVIYMNATNRLKLWDLIDGASSGSRYDISVEQSEFGNFMIERYGGAKVQTMRMEGDGTTILGFDEDPGDSTSDCSSIYVARYSEDDGVCGVYNHGGKGKLIMVDEVDNNQGQPINRLIFEGYYGHVIHQPRALARLYGITNA